MEFEAAKAQLGGTLDELDAAVRVIAAQDSAEAAAALIDRFDALSKQRWSQENYEAKSRIRLALLSMNPPEASSRVLTDSLPFQYAQEDEPRIEGLVFRDERRIPFAANAWSIQPDATFEQALETIWSSLPDVLNALVERIVGVALMKTQRGQVLAYIDLREKDRYEVAKSLRKAPKPPRDRRSFVEWGGRADVSVFVGEALRSETAGAFPVPEPIERLLAVHPVMTDGMWSHSPITDESRFDRFLSDSESVSIFAERMSRPASDFAHLFSYGDDRSDLLDVHGRVFWIANPWEAFGDGEEPVEWLPRIVREQWLHLEED